MDGTPIQAPHRSGRLLPKRLLARRGDERLVAGVRAGDEAAFEVLYERHVAGILSFCRHMLGSQTEAEDAAQQTFASAYHDLLRDDREIRLKAWLYTIARNRCLSMLRARREEDAEVEVSVVGLADDVGRRADLQELVADLLDLPPDQRAALVLHEMDDLSHVEVGEVLGCGAAGVKGLVFRARSGLIERRDARAASCEDIREELASARRGGLRKGRLRHHLKVCPGCAAYLDDVRRQRQMMAVALPVVPGLALKTSVLASAGLGGGGVAGGGGGLALGGLASGATLAKAATVVVIAGSSVTAGRAVLDSPDGPPAGVPAAAPARGAVPEAARDDAPRGAPAAPGERSASDRGAKGRKLGRSKTSSRRKGPKHKQARGQARRLLTPPPARVKPALPVRPIAPKRGATVTPERAPRGGQPKD